MSRKYRMKKRIFLNDEYDYPAYIIAGVEEQGARYSEVHLEIGDCYRRVSLEFELGHDIKELRKTERKLQRFCDTINEFADALQQEIDYKREVIKSLPKTTKKSKKKIMPPEII